MKFYVSSYEMGNEPDNLKVLLPKNSKAVYISNALDFALDREQIKERNKTDMSQIEALGANVEPLDLRDYFGKKEELKNKLDEIDLFYISGGNTFDLRRAMQLCGFDELLVEYLDTDKVYGGYSAAGCVLSKSLQGYDIVDNPNLKTYGDYDTMWNGVGLIDWMFAPHYNSDHDESSDIDKEIAYYKQYNIPYKPLKDGEVIILEIKKKP